MVPLPPGDRGEGPVHADDGGGDPALQARPGAARAAGGHPGGVRRGGPAADAAHGAGEGQGAPP